ncbi:MAG: four helix bundle protein [Candidatus Edwardsbacteria bacterium]
MKIKRFEDLQAWQEARRLVNMVYKAINDSEKFRKDFTLKNQTTDAAISAMSNIAEGFARHSNKEFVQFLFISKASAAEVQSLFYVALDQNYVSTEVFQTVYQQAEKVSKIDSGLITYLLSKKSQPNKPNKPNKLNKPNKPK